MQRIRFLRVLAAFSVESVIPPLTSVAKTSSRCSTHQPSPNTWLYFSSTPVLRQPVVQFPLAQTGEGIAECEVIKWLEGDIVKRFDKVCEVQSDKASIEISSPYEGTVTSLPHEPGDVVKVGSVLMEIDVDEDQLSDELPATKTELKDIKEGQEEKTKREHTDRVLAAPTVRLLAKNSNVKLEDVQPTGPGNTVTKEDVMNFIKRQEQHMQKSVKGENRIQIKGFRRTMLKTMTAALAIPHFHFCDEVDMTSLLSARQRLADEPHLRGLRFTFLPILMKALSAALTEFPMVNSSLSEDQSELILHASHHIGIAMATEAGLVVPNVKDVQKKTIVEIAHELENLKADALMNTLKPENLQETTITVSNVGSVGGIYGTPLITPPQTAIVALGKMRTVLEPVNKEGQIQDFSDLQKRPSLPISWGADHRVLDGAAIVDFSNRWKQLLQEPDRLLLFLK